MLRLFGPCPINPVADPILPYAKTVSKEIVALSTYDDFARQVLEDLDQAEVLLKEVDPINQISIATLNLVSAESYHRY